MYEITFDVARKLLRLALIGHWNRDVIEQFDRDRTATLESLGWSTGSYDCLVDLRQQGVQSREVAERGGEISAVGSHLPRRTAVIASGMLAKLQVERVTGENERVFTSEEEAMAWLREHDQ